MPSVVFYFHVHQPYRLKDYSLFGIGKDHDYFTNATREKLNNQAILHKVANKCYLPMNEILLALLEKYSDFKVSFSISGILLDQLAQYVPQVIDSFRRLVATGRVELVCETYYHSLSFMFSLPEFRAQVLKQKQKLREVFGVTAKAFRNTELIYNNAVGLEAQALGFETILAEGVDRYLGWRSPNYVYRPKGAKNIRLLLKNYTLSDDVAFRFSSRDWHEWPLTAEKYASWISALTDKADVINLFMDYETFGEHQWEDTGIFDFMRQLPGEIKKNPAMNFRTISEAAKAYKVKDEIDMPQLTSWADIERDLSAWMSNSMQISALSTLYNMEQEVKTAKDEEALEAWRRLTVSDHFYYMCTKWFADGDVHKYFSPNETPFEAYKHFMMVLHDLSQRVYAKPEGLV